MSEVAKADATRVETDDLDTLILTEFPYPIAANYRKLLDAKGGEEVTRRCIDLFEYGLRTVTLGLLSQYLGPHARTVRDPVLDRRLYEKLIRAHLGDWVAFLFGCLKAYGGRRDLFFMPELYDFYWDTSRARHRPRKDLQEPFDRLVELRNDMVHGVTPDPDDEEEWQQWAASARQHLRTVLRHFSFLRDYDLIRVVEQRDGELEYQLFTGTEISSCRKPIPPGEEYRAGWFYLASPAGAYLELYPLLVFWTDKAGHEAARARRDAAVFGRLLDKQVEYLATVARRKVLEADSQLLAQVRQLVYYNLEHIKLVGDRSSLSWPKLRRTAEELSQQRTGGMAEKYDPSLYLQRHETLRQFRDFLSSDKTCFVLTGKSGVGKTNFVLSLASELAQDEDVCLLIYNAARLELPDSAVRAISQDFARYLDLRESAQQDLFRELDQRIGMTGKRFVIVYDAINENADGRAVLERIDRMVGGDYHPWLKVMITSRPQAWRSLRRGLPLAEERYYRPAGSEEHQVELKEFTVQMDPFRREELPAVYGKYQQTFGLQTPYAALRPEIREALRDPLTLRLVAQIHRGKAIPQQLRVSDICRQYIESLLRADQLEERDLLLLERDIMPLMLSRGSYDNKATAAQIQEATTNDSHRRPLWELIGNSDLTTDGKKVGQSYARLADHEILTSLGSPMEYVIAFKYERFYDYFAGRRLRVLLQDKPGAKERAAAYGEIIGLLSQKHFLWGVVHGALLGDLEEGRADLVVELSQSIDLPTKELIVSVLTSYGRDHGEEVLALCLRLLELGRTLQAHASPVSIGSLLRKGASGREHPQGTAAAEIEQLQRRSGIHMAKKAAVEVSYHLGLEQALVRAACDDASPTRAVAMQYIYYLWHDDPDAGFRVLEAISRQVVARSVMPDTRALESCLGVSLMILFWHYKDVDKRGQYFARLQQIWQAPIEHILFLREADGRVVAQVKRVVREGILKLFNQLAIRVAGRAEGAVMFSLSELRSFFPPTEQHARLFAAFVPHIDAAHGGSAAIDAIEPELVEVLQDRDLLTTYAAFLAIVSHAMSEPGETVEVLKRLFQIAIDSPPPLVVQGASPAGPMLQVLVWGVRNMMYGNRYAGSELTPIQISLDALDTMADFVRRFEERYGSRCSTTRREYRLCEINSYTYFYYKVHEEVESDLLQFLFDKAASEGDVDALKRYAATLTEVGTHPAWAIPRAAQQALYMIHRITAQMDLRPDERDQVREALIAAFANIRVYHPDAVDDFLAERSEAELPPDMRRAIQNRGATESLGTLLGTAGAWFARDLLVDEDPYMREFLKWLLYRALECRSFEEWIEQLVRRIINIVYGKPVFQVPA